MSSFPFLSNNCFLKAPHTKVGHRVDQRGGACRLDLSLGQVKKVGQFPPNATPARS